MDALKDLKAGIVAFGTAIGMEIAAAEKKIADLLLSATGAVASADIEAVVADLAALQATVEAETAKLGGPLAGPAQQAVQV